MAAKSGHSAYSYGGTICATESLSLDELIKQLEDRIKNKMEYITAAANGLARRDFTFRAFRPKTPPESGSAGQAADVTP